MRLVWFRRVARLGAVLALRRGRRGVGAAHGCRLGCPDWPGCYGHVHPALPRPPWRGDRRVSVAALRYRKAMREMCIATPRARSALSSASRHSRPDRRVAGQPRCRRSSRSASSACRARSALSR